MNIQKKDFVFYLFLFVGLIVFLLALGVLTVKNKDRFTEKEQIPVVVEQEDTSTWKTYRNEQYGFEFKYPSSWTSADQTAGRYITSVQEHPDWGGASGGVFAYQIDDVTTKDPFIFAKNRMSESALTVYSQPEIVFLGGAKAVKQSYKPYEIVPPGTEYLFFDKGFVIVFTDTQEKAQIIPTFKFTNASDISSWKTYRNDQYGFEFKYPENWERSYVGSDPKNPGGAIFDLLSLKRKNMEGYVGIDVQYQMTVRVLNGVVTFSERFLSYNGTLKEDGGPIRPMTLSADVVEAQPEHAVAESVISTFKFTN